MYIVLILKRKRRGGQGGSGEPSIRIHLVFTLRKPEKDPQICKHYNTKYNEEKKRNKFHEH